MKDLQPVYLQNMALSMPGIELQRLQLNRHLRELEAIKPHQHDFDQLLFYLTGRGVQVLPDREVPVRAGSVVLVGAGQAHAFREMQPMRPICLVLDLLLRPPGRRPLVGQLTQIQLSQVRQILSRLMHCARSDLAANQIRVAGLALELTDAALKAVGWLSISRTNMESPLVRQVRRAWLDAQNAGLRPGQVAAKLGYQADYLNRLLKQQCGLTLGQIRDQEFVEWAKRLLRQNLSVGRVAEQIGFADQNYFARWFRSQTGLTPSKFRNTAP